MNQADLKRIEQKFADLQASADKLKAALDELGKRLKKLNDDIDADYVEVDEMNALSGTLRSPPKGDPDHEWDTRDEPNSRIHWTVEQSDKRAM